MKIGVLYTKTKSGGVIVSMTCKDTGIFPTSYIFLCGDMLPLTEEDVYKGLRKGTHRSCCQTFLDSIEAEDRVTDVIAAYCRGLEAWRNFVIPKDTDYDI